MPPQVFMNYIHPSSMLKQLACLWNQGQLCDAVITVDNCIVAKAHRLVLFAASSKLKAQAESSPDGINSAVLQVKLPSMLSQRSIDLFLHYLYEGYLMLTETVIHDMLKIADHLDLKCLYKCCLEYCHQNQIDVTSASSLANSQVEDFGHVRLMNVELKAEDLEPKTTKVAPSTVTSGNASNFNKRRISLTDSSDAKLPKTQVDSSDHSFTNIKQTLQKSLSEKSKVINLDSDDDDECKSSSSLDRNFSQVGESTEPSTSSFQENTREKRVSTKLEMNRSSCSENDSSNYSGPSSQNTSGVYIKTEPNMSPSYSLHTSASQSSVKTDYTVTLDTSNYPMDTEVDIKPILENLEQYEENSAISNEQMLSNQMTSAYYSETSGHSDQQSYMDQDSESYGADYSSVQGFDDQSASGQEGVTFFLVNTNEVSSDSPGVAKGRGSGLDCEVCKKTLYDKSSLRRHRRIHTTLKPYSCSICGRDFQRKDVLRQHMESHSDVRSHVCDICGATFKQKCALSRHKNVIHPMKIEPSIEHSGEKCPEGKLP